MDEGSIEHPSAAGTPLGKVKWCRRGLPFCTVPEGSPDASGSILGAHCFELVCMAVVYTAL